MKKKHTIHIDPAACVGCGLCRKDCPVNNIQVENKKARILEQNCIMCGHCVAVCPKAAVSMTGFDEPPMEIKEKTILNPKVLLEAIRTRRSIRHFKNQSVAPEILEQIIEAGRLTPTGENAQDVSFLVLKERMGEFEKIAVRMFRRLLPFIKLVQPVARRTVIDDDFFFKKAPAAIVLVSKDKINGAFAAANMGLMAEAHGLGVLYSGFFSMAVNRSRTLKKNLGLDRGEKAVITLVVGYSSVTYHRTVQKEAASLRQF